MIDAKEIYLNGNRELYVVTEDEKSGNRLPLSR